jgi:hypothetical protein
MKLSLETYYGRRFESATKNPPKKPLTKKEREYLVETCWKKCLSAYISRMTASGLLSGVDTLEDLKGEAWIAMTNIMDKFDKSKCGKIQKYDEPGKDKPKSVEFYFLNYFYGRVNFMAVDTRSEKKRRGMIGSQSSSVDEVVYNPEDKSINPESKYAYDSLRYLTRELDKQPTGVKELFDEIYVHGLSTSELKERHADYLKLRRLLGSFLKDFESKHQSLLTEEVAGYKGKKRGRRF